MELSAVAALQALLVRRAGLEGPQRKGTVRSFCIVHVDLVSGFKPPYAVVEVQLDEQEDLGYACFVLYWLERLGFCGEGEAWRFIQEGGIEPGGRLPVNTFGGSLGEGRLHGIGHLREGALQAMGRAGTRQIPGGARNCLVQLGVPENSWLVLFGAEP